MEDFICCVFVFLLVGVIEDKKNEIVFYLECKGFCVVEIEKIEK